MHDFLLMAVGAILILMAFGLIYQHGQLKSTRLVNDHLHKQNSELTSVLTTVRAQAAEIVEREKAFLQKPTFVHLSDNAAMAMAARIIEYLPKDKDIVTH